MTIQIEPRYLLHDSGTKFYEQITFLNLTDKRFVVVNRWAAVAKKATGGGQTDIKQYTDARAAHADAASKLISKRKTHNGGKYEDVTERFGLHGQPKELSPGVLRDALIDHYGRASGLDIFMRLGLDADTDDYEMEVDVVEEKAASTKPEPPRDGDWGTW